MAVFNKILNILILVLAGAAVFFGFMLFGKREQLKDRGDAMAKVIRSVAGTLDEGSDTDVKSKLKLSKSASSNVSLYHDNFKNLGKVLGAFETQAADVIAQRDALAKTLFGVAKTLDIPNYDSFAAVQFQSNDKYNKKDSDLLVALGKVEKRQSAIVSKLTTIAKQVNCTMDPSALKSLDGYSAPLNDFSAKITAMKEKSDALASHVQSVCSAWDVSAPSLDGDDYADALSAAANSLKSKKDDYLQAKADLKNKEEQLTVVNEKLTQKIEVISQGKNKIKDLEKRLAAYEGDKSGDDGSTPSSTPKSEMDLVNMLEGKVLRVNKKWGFVMIDLGNDNKMVIGNVKKVEKSIPLPEGQVMDVARNDKFIGQIKVVKVNNDCSIADMVGGPTENDIRPGDKVFFARKIIVAKKSNGDEEDVDDEDTVDSEKSDDDEEEASDSDTEEE
jgi:hypothetical protein